MKRILFTAAVEEELSSASRAFNELFRGYKGLDDSNIEVDFIITGIGTTATTYFLTRALCVPDIHYDLIVNIGVGSTFTDKYPVGSTVRIIKEQFSDMGVESRMGFQTLFEYEILDANTIPFKNGALFAPYLDIEMENALTDIPSLSGVTVHTLLEAGERVEQVKERFAPDVESMEGGAFFYVAIMEKVPFIELRGISNVVGERDKTKWETAKALDSLTLACKEILKALV